MRASPHRLARALGHAFDRPKLLEQALTHRSAGRPNNERLEFLGDALLGLFVAEALFSRFDRADEGQLSRLRAGLVKKETLAALARDLDLGDYLNLGAGELRSGGHTRDSILADTMEALFAAVYLDGGMERARSVVLGLFRRRLEHTDPEQLRKDPKTRLQEYLQAQQQQLPEYAVMDVSGSQHAQVFRVSCRVPDLSREAEGSGTSRRKAEQQAALNMMQQLLDND